MKESPRNSLGQNTGVGSLALVQGVFPTQGSNPDHPHFRWILYQLRHKWSPRILEWVAYPLSSRSSRPRNQTGSPALTVGGFFTNWAIREAHMYGRLSGEESTCSAGDPRFHPWVGKTPWRRKLQPTPVFLTGKSHGQRSLASSSPWGHRVRQDWATEQHTAHTLLQGIVPTQGGKSGLLHCRQILYRLSHQGSPFTHISVCMIYAAHNQNQMPTVAKAGFWSSLEASGPARKALTSVLSFLIHKIGMIILPLVVLRSK